MASVKLPELRKDLNITQQTQRGIVVYIVKDPLDGQYYKFESLEFSILSLLDGTKSYAKITEIVNQKNPDYELEVDDIKDFISSVNKMNLLEKSLAEKNTMLVAKLQESRNSNVLSKKGSALYKRFPLCNPDKFFTKIHPYISFFWKKPFVIFSIILIMTAWTIMLYNTKEILEGITGIYSFQGKNLLGAVILWLTIFTVIGLHECAHGLTCKNFGGHVPELGFLLLFFQPCFYANVNDAWSFTNKKHKLYVVFAGGYFEFFLGAFFTFTWISTNPGTTINSIAYQGMLVCGISSVLFNFNPLMKFDGYYALADYLEIPNLKKDSFAYLKAFVRAKIFHVGTMEAYEDQDPKTSRALLIYGICSFLYMSTIMIGILVIVKMFVLDSLMEIGLLLIIAAFFKFIGPHIKNSFKFMKEFYIMKNLRLTTGKGFIAFIIPAAIVILLLFIIPFPDNITAPCSLKAMNKISLHTEIEGELKKVNFKNSDKIKKDSVLIELENKDKKNDLRDKKIELESLILQLRLARSSGDNYKKEKLNLEINMLKEEINKLTREIEKLKIKVPFDSILLTDDLNFETGKNYSKGELIAEILPVSKINAEIKVFQEDIGYFKKGRPLKLKLKAYPRNTLKGTILKILPKELDKSSKKEFLVLSEFNTKNFNHPLNPGLTGIIKIDLPKAIGIKLIYKWLVKNLKFDIMFY